MKRKFLNVVSAVLLILVLAGGMLILKRPSGVAPLPVAFSSNYTYPQALELSRQRHVPVLVFASADWCGPCQSYKRGALADARVTARLRDTTIPVYINVDHEPELSEKLQVTSIPTLYLLRDGNVISKLIGTQDAKQLLEWLDAAGKQ